jgi:predicted anti-sigma-YlaC factor YlaD
MAEPANDITCQELVELVNDYFEGELTAGQTERFEQHLNDCAGCESYVDQMRITVETVGRMREQDMPPQVRDRLQTAFRDWKRP